MILQQRSMRLPAGLLTMNCSACNSSSRLRHPSDAAYCGRRSSAGTANGRAVAASPEWRPCLAFPSRVSRRGAAFAACSTFVNSFDIL